MVEEAHWFESGGKRLFGVLHRAEDARGTVLILHGFTGDHIGAKYQFVDLAREIRRNGFNAFRFDYAGSGNSEGDFSDQNLETTVRDAVNAVEHLESDGVDTGSLGVVGHSKGGSTAILLSEERGVDALTTWSTVSDYGDLWPDELGEHADTEEVVLYGFRYPFDNAVEPLDYDFPGLVSGLDIPTFFVHGERDEDVPPRHSRELYDAASEPKELLLLENSDHVFTDPSERRELVDKTAEWLENNL
ncbi:MAG: alpha/beta hydrolase [Candidatus Nanohaloarchaea archaeon]